MNSFRTFLSESEDAKRAAGAKEVQSTRHHKNHHHGYKNKKRLPTSRNLNQKPTDSEEEVDSEA